MATEECGGDVSLRIYSPAIEKGIVFSQIKMTGFSDTVTPSWTEESVYGRMDPIVTYQGTTRAMSLTFELGPFSESDNRKKLALGKISRLMQMQYPTYSGRSDSALAISRPPLLNITFHNYISEELVCYLSDVSYAPVDGMSATTVPKFNGSEILPQRISVSLNIKVLHTKAPGWSDSGEWLGGRVGPMNPDPSPAEPVVTNGGTTPEVFVTEDTNQFDALFGAAMATTLNSIEVPESQAQAEDPFSLSGTDFDIGDDPFGEVTYDKDASTTTGAGGAGYA